FFTTASRRWANSEKPLLRSACANSMSSLPLRTLSLGESANAAHAPVATNPTTRTRRLIDRLSGSLGVLLAGILIVILLLALLALAALLLATALVLLLLQR